MKSPIIRDEFQGEMHGVKGRFTAVTIGGNGYKPGTFTHQQFLASRDYVDSYGVKCRMRLRVEFDDELRNGANSFAITCTIDEIKSNGRIVDYGGGADHVEIARAFPELAHLAQWHLCATDGPMQYVANTVYLAGDRDPRGKRAGEPWAFSEAIQFGDNPIKHKVKRKFWQFLKDAKPHNGRGAYDFEVIEVAERKESTSGKTEYYRKYTFGGFAAKWYECPFDTEQEALDFLKALQTCKPQFLQIPTLFSDGKARELDAARRVAIWPDATEAELSLPKEELTERLKARLPDLLKRFRETVEGAGFLWQPPS